MTGTDHQIPARMAAFAVALQARNDGLTQHAVDDMRGRAEELLAKDDPLRAAILDFATQYELIRRDPYALKKHGEQLQRALDAAIGAAPPERPERKDIDG